MRTNFFCVTVQDLWAQYISNKLPIFLAPLSFFAFCFGVSYHTSFCLECSSTSISLLPISFNFHFQYIHSGHSTCNAMSPSEAQTADDSSSSGLMDMLVAGNAQIMDARESSACEEQCRTEQAAIVACIDSIRSARESHEGNITGTSNTADDSESAGHTSGKVECMAPAVAAWTKCCSDANNSSAD